MSYLDIEGVGAILPGEFAPELPRGRPFTRDEQMRAAHAASLQRQAEAQRAHEEYLKNVYGVEGVGAAMPRPQLQMRTPFTREAQMRAAHAASMRARERAALQQLEQQEQERERERRGMEAQRQSREVRLYWHRPDTGPQGDPFGVYLRLNAPAGVWWKNVHLDQGDMHGIVYVKFIGQDGTHTTVISPKIPGKLAMGFGARWKPEKYGSRLINFITRQPGRFDIALTSRSDRTRSRTTGSIIGWRLTTAEQWGAAHRTAPKVGAEEYAYLCEF